MDPKWYHVCWPRLTAKRVEPVVSINWASCFCSHWSINAAAFFACDNFVGDWLVFSCLICFLVVWRYGVGVFSVASIGGGALWGSADPRRKWKWIFFKIKFTSFHVGRANGAAALTYFLTRLRYTIWQQLFFACPAVPQQGRLSTSCNEPTTSCWFIAAGTQTALCHRCICGPVGCAVCSWINKSYGI